MGNPLDRRRVCTGGDLTLCHRSSSPSIQLVGFISDRNEFLNSIGLFGTFVSIGWSDDFSFVIVLEIKIKIKIYSFRERRWK